MTELEFNRLSKDLHSLVKIVPLNWGSIQNDSTDSQIDMWKINTFAELEGKLIDLRENSKIYFRRRWFLWKCAQCDEHIFAMNKNVTQNPNARDQAYDIEFYDIPSLRFDVKGTVIPRSFRVNVPQVLQDPTNMIKFYYDEQSKGIRNNHQNRLFIVHHSFVVQEREMYLRCNWEYKKLVYQEYSSRIQLDSNFVNYQNTKSDVVFIIENLDKTITHKFFAV